MYGTVAGTAAAGDEVYYLWQIPAAGALKVKLTPGTGNVGEIKLEVLDARNLAVLAQASVATGPDASGLIKSLPVEAGQRVLLHLSAAGSVPIPFALEFSNLDAYENLRDGVLRFPVGSGASQAAFADLNGDGTLDALVSDALADTVAVLLGNGDGTFQSPREFRVGASPGNLGIGLELPTYRRDLIVADINRDGIPDAIVANYSSSDVTVLLGRGDGTFQGQRRYNATATPWALALGDVNADGWADLVVHDSVRPPDQTASLAVLLGRNDGGFRPEQVFRSPISPNSHWPDVALGDVNRDGNLDVVVVGDLEPAGGRVLLGNGAGRFAEGPKLPLVGFGVELVDLNGDGLLDAVSVNKYDNAVQYALGQGDGTFAAARAVTTGQSPIALAISDIGSPVKDSKQLGPPDGRPDIVVANSGISQPSFSGPAELVVLLATEDKDQAFSGFAAPIRLAGAKAPQDVDVFDVNGDGKLDVVAVDSGSLLVVFGSPPEIAANNTPETARDLGASFHLVQPTETVVPDHADDYYVFTVPSEPVRGAGEQVVDISALFQFQDGPGLAMEILDRRGVVRGVGERVRMAAAQGERLWIHVFGQEDVGDVRGTGTFTLVINVRTPDMTGDFLGIR